MAKNIENLEDFQLNIACFINSFSFDKVPKENANQITRQISDVNEYSWK